mgnify:CR=1 FL=1
MGFKRLNFLLVCLGFLFVLSFLIPWAAPQNPLDINLDGRLMAPSANHLFGTDDLGRDVLSRVLQGFSTTVMVSLSALVSALLIGIVLGGLAGYYYKRWVDAGFNWIVSLIMSIPFLLIMASILSLTTPSIYKAYVILAAVMWVNTARLVRAEVIKRMPLDYVMASRALGSTEWNIMVKDILPACTQSGVYFSITYLPEIIALEAGLSFLGLGVQPPAPGLGKMIFDGLNYIISAPWMALFPALSLFVLVFTINLIVKFRGGEYAKLIR